ncbi:MAG: hypothetical protein JWM44_4006 [Bacilli bacterium]|nr:hypothetical protein [Bacilli bacterium]
MEKNTLDTKKRVYLFHVDVVIEGYNKAMALDALENLLKTEKIKYFQLEEEANEVHPIEDDKLKPRRKEQLAKPIEPKPTITVGYQHIIDQIEQFKVNNTLIRLSIVKSKGIKLSVPCRVLNYDDATQIVTIYHVDEKKVYQYKLNEIDDLIIN